MSNRYHGGAGAQPAAKSSSAVIGTNGKDSIIINKIIRETILNKPRDAPMYNYDQIDGSYSYTEGLKMYKTNCHLGQRKLLLNEIQFYTCYVRGKRPLIIYAGSASGEHTPIILRLFPDVRLLLVDPNYHNIDSKTKYVYQNTSVISDSNLREFKNYIRGRGDNRIEHLKRGALRLNSMEFMYSGLIDTIASADKHDTNHNKNNKTAAKDMQEFYAGNYEKLVEDMFNDKDTRVFIVQDYMTTDLTKLIKLSIDRANKNASGGASGGVSGGVSEGASESADSIGKDEVDASTGPAVTVYFVTDIRTNMFNFAPTELDYIWNYALQIAYLKILQPEYSMLKYHPPYFKPEDTSVADLDNPNSKIGKHPMRDVIANDIEYVKKQYNIDMLADYRAGAFMYFTADTIFNQPWGPVGTSEARLIVSRAGVNSDMVPYSHKEWEDKYFYLRYDRMFAYYSTFYDIIKSHKRNEYDACSDCCLEILILGNYLLLADEITGATPAQSPPSGSIDFTAIQKRMSDPKFLDDLFDMYQDINKVTFYNLKYNRKCPTHGMLKHTPSQVNAYIVDSWAKNEKSFTRLIIKPDATDEEKFTLLSNNGQIITRGKANFDLSPENKSDYQRRVLSDIMQRLHR